MAAPLVANHETFRFPETRIRDEQGRMIGGRFPKPGVWKLLGYEPTEVEVMRFHRSQARIRIPCAPARTSKSYSTAYDVIPSLLPEWERGKAGKLIPVAVRPGQHTKKCWLVAPSYSPNKEFDYLWTELVIRGPKRHGLPYELGSHSYSPKQGSLEIELRFGKDRDGEPVRTVVEGKSATNPEALQAEEVDIWVGCEAAEHDPKIWQRYGSTRSREAIFPTTPKRSGVWLKRMIDDAESLVHAPGCGERCVRGCAVIETGIEAFTFTPWCNPTYDWGRFWKEHAAAERRVEARVRTPARGHDCFAVETACRAMQDPWFAEQFGGRWTFEADKVIPFKARPNFPGDWCHVLDEAPDWLFESRHFVAVDYGVTDPTCVHWYALGSDGQLCLYRELYETGLDTELLTRRVLDINRRFGERIEWCVGDPQKPEVAKVFARYGLPVIPINKGATRDRAAGHLRLVNALSPQANGKPRLHVLSERAGAGYGCPKTIAEWMALRRKDGSQNEWSATALAGADHAFDCARYALSSMPERHARQDTLDRELHELRVIGRRFAQSQRHTGPLTGPVPARRLQNGA